MHDVAMLQMDEGGANLCDNRGGRLIDAQHAKTHNRGQAVPHGALMVNWTCNRMYIFIRTVAGRARREDATAGRRLQGCKFVYSPWHHTEHLCSLVLVLAW